MPASIIRQDCCGGEFRIANFGLDYSDPDAFVSAQWRRPSLAYTVYRVVTAVYFLVWVVICWAHAASGEGWHQVRFLTEWSFDLLTISLVLRAAVSVYGYHKQRNCAPYPAFPTMHWSLKTCWVLYNVSSCIAVCLTFFYWFLLFNPNNSFSPLEWALDIQRHVLQAIFILADLFVTDMPIRLYHLFHSWIYCLIYALFNVAYVLIPPGHPPVYELIDWKNKPGLALGTSFAFTFIGMSAVWTALYGLFRLRLYIFTVISQKCAEVKQNTGKVAEDGYQRQSSTDMDAGLISETNMTQ